MDLKLLNAEASPEERAAIDAAIGALSPVGAGGVSAKRHFLLPALEAAQARVGWISEGALNHICRTLDVPPADAYGVMTFYALLATAPRARRVVHVCDDIACKAKGADALVAELGRSAGPPAHHAPEGDHVVIGDDDAAWLPSPCLGLCDQAPAAFVQIAGEEPVEELFGDVSVDRLRAAMGGALAIARVPRPRLPQAGDPSLRLLRRVDVIDPASLDAYRAHGGYEALRIALEIGPEGVVREVIDSKLMGRGGAAFPTGRKWDAVAKQPVRPHFLICNADESEPGTFKDRALMEGDPFALVEAMTIAGYATACNL